MGRLTKKNLIEEEKKLVDAYIDNNGKFWIKETYPIDDEGGMYYIASKELKLPPQNRLNSEFAKSLIDEGKAICIKRDEWEAFKNSVKVCY